MCHTNSKESLTNIQMNNNYSYSVGSPVCLYLVDHWPQVQEDKWAKAVTEGFVCTVNTVEVYFHETVSGRQLNPISERGRNKV